MKILIVENDSHVAESTERILRLQGHVVTLAATPAEARCALAQDASLQAMLADQLLEADESGQELLAWAALAHPGVRRVLVSGNPPPEGYVVRDPVQRFLRKPFGRAEVDEVLGP